MRMLKKEKHLKSNQWASKIGQVPLPEGSHGRSCVLPNIASRLGLPLLSKKKKTTMASISVAHSIHFLQKYNNRSAQLLNSGTQSMYLHT